MKKKFLPLSALGLITVLSLSACTGSPSTGGTPGQNTTAGSGSNSSSTGNNGGGGGSNGSGTGDNSSGSGSNGSNGSGSGNNGADSGGGTNGSGTGDNNSDSGSSNLGETGAAGGKLAAEALQKYLVSLDTEADTNNPSNDYNSIRTAFPASAAVVSSDMPPQHAVAMYKEYAKNLRLTPAGNEITVVDDGLAPDDKGNVTIKSSAIRIAFYGKPRQVDKVGKDTFVVKYKNGGWKIVDATIG